MVIDLREKFYFHRNSLQKNYILIFLDQRFIFISYRIIFFLKLTIYFIQK